MVCQKTISLFYNTLQQKWSVRNRTLHSYTNTADHVTMFFDLKDRKDIPLSYADHVTMK